MKARRYQIRESEVTPEALTLRRREFLCAAAAVSLVAAGCLPGDEGEAKSAATQALEPLANVKSAPAGPLRATEALTPYESATAYNNFYEFGTDKEDPAANAGSLRPKPWSVVIEGEVTKPGVVPLETLTASSSRRSPGRWPSVPT